MGKALALVPVTATIKGLFLTSSVEGLGPIRARLADGSKRYVAFKDYPLVEQVRLLAEVAGLLHRDLPLREAIRRIGHRVYPAFSQALVGKALFATVGRDPCAMLRAGSKACSMSASVGTVEIVESSEQSAMLRWTAIDNFIDCYQVGIIEGAFAVLGLKPTLRRKLDGPTPGSFELSWSR